MYPLNLVTVSLPSSKLSMRDSDRKIDDRFFTALALKTCASVASTDIWDIASVRCTMISKFFAELEIQRARVQDEYLVNIPRENVNNQSY